MKSLVINVGSTSTKVAIYNDSEQEKISIIRHSLEDLSVFPKLIDQLDFRKGVILDFLKESKNVPSDFDCIMSRGGSPPYAQSGATLVNDEMCKQLIEHPKDSNPASLGPVIGYEIAKEAGIPAYIYDPISADELFPLAKIFGVKGIYHTSMSHVLNTRATGIVVANQLNKPFESLNLIVIHIGGGNTVALWSGGKLIDTVPTDDGSFSAERCGNIRNLQVIELIEEYGLDAFKSWLGGKGGFVSLLGTNELKKVEEMIAGGDEFALQCEQAMSYQLSRNCLSLFPAVHGKIDGVVFTGGGAYWERLVNDIKKWIEFTEVPTFICPGENEMQALADGAYRVTTGTEEVHTYLAE